MKRANRRGIRNIRKVPDGAFRIGKRIAFRPNNKSDATLLYKWINDPEITQFLKINVPKSLQEEEKWIEGHAGRKPGEIILGIVLLETGQLIGTMGLHKISFVNGTAVTGSIIGEKQYWNKGYGTEAKMLLLDYAFNSLGLRKVCSSFLAFNDRSKHCLENCGYVPEGVLPQQIFRNGGYVDEILMAVYKENFLKLWAVYKAKYLL
jgi:RimJ/RimL family protein N-acetyltransferase